MIYLDNAATTLRKPPQVGQAMLEALNSMGNSSRGTHESSLGASRIIYSARVKLAKFFGCARPDHVIFTSGVTESLNLAINGLIGPGDHVVSTDLEHNSVLRPLYRLEAERAIALDFAPAGGKAGLDYAALEALVRPGTKAVVCTHCSNLTGNIVDVARVAEIAHARGALLIVDAAQTAGTRPVDMRLLGADVLCFTGHKGLMGPQGTGGLCIREGVVPRPFKVGGTGVQTYSRSQPEPFPVCLEAGTLNGHGIAGLSAALDFLNETGLDRIQAHEAALTRRFYEGVRSVPGVTVYGDFEGEHGAAVALNIGSLDSGSVSDILSEDYGIATRPGGHCAPRMHQALGTAGQGAVRFSFSWYNTMEEAGLAAAAVRELAAG